MDCLKFYPGLACPTLLLPAGGPPLKRPYSRFSSGPPAGQVAGLQPSSTPLDTPRRKPMTKYSRMFFPHRSK
jgi:hypothetical protein